VLSIYNGLAENPRFFKKKQNLSEIGKLFDRRLMGIIFEQLDEFFRGER